MGKSSKKDKEKRGGSKLGRLLFGRHRKSSLQLDQSEGKVSGHHDNYRAIGRVNMRHLQNSQCWDVKYLGLIPDIEDWQSPESRTEFLQLIDQAQIRGQIMWSSLTPKLLHISPRWLVITDTRKKVTYGEILISSIGSLSYAEDENRHMLGIKTTRPAAPAAASMHSGKGVSMQDETVTDGHFCCHVLECASEVMVRQICSQVSEYFRGLVMQLEAEKQLRQEEVQQVKSKMLKRLSTMPEAARTAPERPATDRVSPERVSTEHVPTTDRRSPNKTSTGGPAPNKVLHLAGSQTTPASTGSLTLDQTLENLEMELGPSTSSPANNLPSQEDSIMQEIGRQFSAITKEPSQRHRGRRAKKDPNPKRLSTGSAGRKKWVSRESSDSIPDLLPPLSVDKPGRHDGRVLTQHLEDATGVHITEDNDYLVPKRSQRTGIADVVYKQRMEGPQSTTKSASRSSGGETGEESSQAVLRTSLLLETMEDGEKETRIDGDGKNNFLVQTTMGEKETAIVGRHGNALLLPTSELDNYDTTEQQQGTMDTEENSLSASGPLLPPPPSEPKIQPKPEPEPEPEVPMREPWPDLIGIDDTPSDPRQKSFLEEVAQVLGNIEYRQFRQNWLDYQQCKLNIVQFFKKIKLLFRGSRASLREGTQVLLDPLDQEDFKDLLDGKEVEPKPMKTSSGATQAPARSSTVKKQVTNKSAGPPVATKKPGGHSFNIAASTPSAGSCPAPVRTGGLGNKLLMFEQLNTQGDDNDSLSTDRPKPRSIAQLIQKQENRDIYSPEVEPQRRGGIGSRISNFEDNDNKRRDGDRSDQRYGRDDRYDEDDRHGRRHSKRDDPDDYKGRHGKRDDSGDRKRRHGKRDDSGNRKRRHGKRDDSGDRKRRHGKKDGSGDHKGRHGRRDEPGEDQPRKDRHHKKSDMERKRKKEDEKKQKSREHQKKIDSIGLQGILDAGDDLLSPSKTDDTIHALSKLMGSEEVDYLQLTTQFLEEQTKEKLTNTTPAKETDKPSQKVTASSTTQVTPVALPPQVQQALVGYMPPTPITQYVQPTAPTPYVQTSQYVQPAAQYVIQTQPTAPSTQYIQQAAPTQYIQQPAHAPQIVQQAPQVVQQAPQVVQQAPHTQYVQPTIELVQSKPPVVQYVQQTEPYVQQTTPTQYVQVEAATDYAESQTVQYVQENQQLSPGEQVVQYSHDSQQPQPDVVLYVQDRAQPEIVEYVQDTQQQPLAQPPHRQHNAEQLSFTQRGAQNMQSQQNMQPIQQSVQQRIPQPNFDSTMVDEDNVLTRFSDDENVTTPLFPPPATSGPPPPPATSGPPPPPPPPPPPISSHPPLRPPPSQSPRALPKTEDDMNAQRDDLLEQIKGGAPLKKTPDQKMEDLPPTDDDIFAEIRSGMKLRKVPENEKRVKTGLRGKVVDDVKSQERRRDKEHKKGRNRDERKSEREREEGGRHEGRREDSPRRRHHRRDDYSDEGLEEDDQWQEESRGREKNHSSLREVESDDRKERRREEGRGRRERERGREEKDRQRKEEKEQKSKARERRRRSVSDEDYYSENEDKRGSAAPQQEQEVRFKLPGLGGKRRSDLKSVGNAAIPAWKAALLERKQGIVEQAEAAAAPADEGQVDGNLPAWKQALLKKKQAETIQREREERGEFEDAELAHLPQWKKKLVKKMNAEKAVREHEDNLKKQTYLNKKAEIAAMPEWKRKLYMEKNPQYAE